MNLFLRHPERNEWPAHSSAVLPMLGLKPGRHLPPEGMPPREIQGITVWVKPQEANRKSSLHRVYAKCPACGKEMSVGRLPQHASVHKPAAPQYMAYNHNGTKLINAPVSKPLADKEAAEYSRATGENAYVEQVSS